MENSFVLVKELLGMFPYNIIWIMFLPLFILIKSIILIADFRSENYLSSHKNSEDLENEILDIERNYIILDGEKISR